MIVVGYDFPTSKIAVQLAQAHPNLRASVGLHPHDARLLNDDLLETLRALAQQPRVVALGETGLDFYRDLSPRSVQREAFLRHLELATELHLPLICHCREAEDALLEMLAPWSHLTRIWHCFDGAPAQAQAATAAGIWLGFGGTITYPNSERRQEAVRVTPLNRLLLETDAPYLAPYDREGVRPRDNEPAHLPTIAARLAELKGESLATTAATTTKNAHEVFSLDSRP